MSLRMHTRGGISITVWLTLRCHSLCLWHLHIKKGASVLLCIH